MSMVPFHTYLKPIRFALKGSPEGGGREAGRLGLGRYPEGTTGKSPKSEPVRWAGGGNVPLSGARFAQDMPESIVATDRNRLNHGGQCLLPQ
jgi:hypothetical protein